MKAVPLSLARLVNFFFFFFQQNVILSIPNDALPGIMKNLSEAVSLLHRLNNILFLKKEFAVKIV